MNTPIIVLTPIKNEKWILDRFLQITSTFADTIIVADQQSTDNSVKICKKYPKVHIINNPGTAYDEAFRQNLLINEARKLHSRKKILLALDADEIMTADSLNSKEWNQLKEAPIGTVLYFQKPDLYQTVKRVLDFGTHVPLGFIDDGSAHDATTIHSVRIPVPKNANTLYCEQIRFLHYAMIRMDAQQSKNRLYSAITNVSENHNNIIAHLRRRKRHSRYFDYTNGAKILNTPKEWFTGWEKRGINVTEYQKSKYYSYDLQLLQIIKQHGEKKFWYDDIWKNKEYSFDLEECRSYFFSNKALGISQKTLKTAPAPLNQMLHVFDFIIKRCVNVQTN